MVARKRNSDPFALTFWLACQTFPKHQKKAQNGINQIPILLYPYHFLKLNLISPATERGHTFTLGKLDCNEIHSLH